MNRIQKKNLENSNHFWWLRSVCILGGRNAGIVYNLGQVYNLDANYSYRITPASIICSVFEI